MQVNNSNKYINSIFMTKRKKVNMIFYHVLVTINQENKRILQGYVPISNNN